MPTYKTVRARAKLLETSKAPLRTPASTEEKPLAQR
jgi:hypothetical protein